MQHRGASYSVIRTKLLKDHRPRVWNSNWEAKYRVEPGYNDID